MAEPIRSPPLVERIEWPSAEVRRPQLIRRDSMSSNASFYSDVEMAQHEVLSCFT